MANPALDDLSNEELKALVELYAKNWLAMDGIWFQGAEKRFGMDSAMEMDCEVWAAFSPLEGQKLKRLLALPDDSGLDGLKRAFALRMYTSINDDELIDDGASLVYRTLSCRVQAARERKGMPLHPCKEVGLVEFPAFARAIDPRIKCECLSCYPDICDESCHCAWRFTID